MSRLEPGTEYFWKPWPAFPSHTVYLLSEIINNEYLGPGVTILGGQRLFQHLTFGREFGEDLSGYPEDKKDKYSAHSQMQNELLSTTGSGAGDIDTVIADTCLALSVCQEWF